MGWECSRRGAFSLRSLRTHICHGTLTIYVRLNYRTEMDFASSESSAYQNEWAQAEEFVFRGHPQARSWSIAYGDETLERARGIAFLSARPAARGKENVNSLVLGKGEALGSSLAFEGTERLVKKENKKGEKADREKVQRPASASLKVHVEARASRTARQIMIGSCR